ncbi:MAG: DegT/DnrJ/EryC1/StrS family aminotransferase [Clostridia bacterium]|nr:DegT/DnrJ/EryC1/StrS family aminotransferase [Clostridia bacterium]
MSSPIYDAIIKYQDKKMKKFHMPGHKGVCEALYPLENILKYDVTEIPDTGSLFDNIGPTKEAQDMATKLFETKGTFMSAGGCTLCIQTMLRLVCPTGGKILMSRVIHRSAINAMSLLNITPVWLYPDNSAGEYFSGRITAECVKNAIEKNPDAKAVYITSPDYFGVISDIKAISQAAVDIPVIVDCAHGAHLGFLDDAYSPVRQGAAMSAESAHKTLPVLTGGAWLNVGDEKYLDNTSEAMALFGSTSPSYPIMLSLDLCRDWLENGGKEILRKTAKRTEKIKELIVKLGFKIPEGLCDPMRIAFVAENCDNVGDQLRENMIEPEYAEGSTVIIIPTPFNTEDDFIALENALKNIKCNGTTKMASTEVFVGEQKLTPTQALLSENKTVSLENAVGEISAETLCPCPPAIPLVMAGEEIDEATVKRLAENGFSHLRIVLK